MLLLIGSFIAGMLTVLAPCVLALLPIIIGGSVSGNTGDKKRPLIIAASLAVSLLLFTLALKATTLFISVPPATFTYISGGIIIALGLLTLFPSVYARLIAKLGIEQRAQATLSKGYRNTNQYLGPILIGAALGPVFSSCSPVYAYLIATVLPTDFATAMVYIVFYILGLSLVLLLIGYFGQRFVSKIKFASNPKGWFQRVIAILFIIVGLLIITGYDKRSQAWVSTHTPFNFDSLSSQLLPGSDRKTNADVLNIAEPYPAPAFVGLTDWINSKPLSQEDLKGKVVLVDFWTYSCINCIRNNPYLIKWHETYKDKGFAVIGVHAPEFAFERNRVNVEKAVKDQKITYPVALDNDFATWNAFDNRSWPASYLIDADGQIRRVHEGEGEYDITEQAIRALLEENGANLRSTGMTAGSASVPVTSRQTPETYLGATRASNFKNTKGLAAAPVQTFVPAADLPKNFWTLGGTWEVQDKKIIARGDSILRFHIAAREAYVVMGSAAPAKVGVQLNGQPISGQKAAGRDVDNKNSAVTVGEYKLYRLVDFGQFRGDSTIELRVPDGVELNVFTFGS
ncbi:MAG TPA: cytochrome c biogenesis protein CcdA [Candidatus Saccharimonadales bacterium]|nr:cytochrome c biogenesis protein CcdA [Candidatus Saccharimonadales bacterium]